MVGYSCFQIEVRYYCATNELWYTHVIRTVILFCRHGGAGQLREVQRVPLVAVVVKTLQYWRCIHSWVLHRREMN